MEEAGGELSHWKAFILMERHWGINLTEFILKIKDSKVLSLEDKIDCVYKIFVETLKGLKILDEVGILHLDLHGGNIFLELSKNWNFEEIIQEPERLFTKDTSFKVLILDFGESRADDKLELLHQQISERGDSHIQAPESDSFGVTSKADIWSLAANIVFVILGI